MKAKELQQKLSRIQSRAHNLTESIQFLQRELDIEECSKQVKGDNK